MQGIGNGVESKETGLSPERAVVGGARWSNSGYDFMEYAYLHVNKSGDVVTGPPNVPAGGLPGERNLPKMFP